MYESEFRFLFKNISLPQQLTESYLNELGADIVFEGQQPTGGTVYQFSQENGVEQIDGKWYTKFVLGPIFSDKTDNDGNIITAAQNEVIYKSLIDAEEASKIRDIRNEKLKECDWTQIPDCNIPKKTNWATYRQSLRDITTQSGFPWNITWPDAP